MTLLIRAFLVAILSVSVLCFSNGLPCDEHDCESAFAFLDHHEDLPSYILEVYRSGRSAQSLFQRLPKPNFSSDQLNELLILCIKYRKFHSFEHIVENLTDNESQWFSPDLQRSILESPISIIFMELLPAKSIYTSSKVELLLMAISIPNVDIIDYILSDSQFIDFGQVKESEWEQIFTAIGIHGNKRVLNKLHDSCPIDLRRYGHIYILAAAECENFDLVEGALGSSSIYQYGMEQDLAYILVRKNQIALYLKLVKRFALQDCSTVLPSSHLLLAAIHYASFQLFEQVLARHRGSLSFDSASFSMAMAQADLHADADLYNQLKGLDLEGTYPLPFALAASLGFVDKLYTLQHAASLQSDATFDSLELLKKYYPLYAFNMKYSQLPDPMLISLFYSSKLLSASFQSYIGAYDAASRGSIECLTAFYEHDFFIPTCLEYNVMMAVIRAGHVEVFAFILERFSTVDNLCEAPEIQMAVIKSRNVDLLRVLLETWPPTCLDILQLAVDILDPVGLQCILDNAKGFTFNEHLVRKAFDSLVQAGPKAKFTLKVLLQHFKRYAKAIVEQLIIVKDLDKLQAVLDCGCIEMTEGLYIKAIIHSDLEIVKLIRSQMPQIGDECMFKALYDSVRRNSPYLVSFVLKDDFLLQTSQLRQILRIAASLPSSDILYLLLEDKRFAIAADHQDLLCHAIKKDTHHCVRYLLPLAQVNHLVFSHAIRSRSREHRHAVLSHPSLALKNRMWWKRAAKTVGKVGDQDALRMVMTANPSIKLKHVFAGAESHFRIDMIRHLTYIESGFRTANTAWIGRLLHALRHFDVSLITESLQELRSHNPSAHDLVLPQLDNLFLDHKHIIIQFASAPPEVRQSRKTWYKYRLTEQ